MFTRAAILELERSGKLARTDLLSRFLPGFPAGETVTVQHLVDHQSGIARDLPPGLDLQSPRTLDELVAIIARQPIEAKAGERAAYSNNGYRLLAKIIEVAGGGSFDRLIGELVLEPRAMRDTVPNIGSGISRVAKGFQPGAGWRERVLAPAFDMTNWRGAGSFLVTPADMMRFVKTLPLQASDLASAAGVDSAGKPKPRGVGHDGFGDGFANLAFAYPDDRAYMVSLSNMQTGAFTPMHADLRRLLFGEAVESPIVPDTSPPPPMGDWDRYIGDYDLRPGAPLLIRRKDDYLTADAGEGGHPLIPLGGDRFFMRLRYATMIFEGPAGQPAGLLRWAEGGGEFPLKRIA